MSDLGSGATDAPTPFNTGSTVHEVGYMKTQSWYKTLCVCVCVFVKQVRNQRQLYRRKQLCHESNSIKKYCRIGMTQNRGGALPLEMEGLKFTMLWGMPTFMDTPSFYWVLIDSYGRINGRSKLEKVWCIYYIQLWSSHVFTVHIFMTTPTNDGL